MRRPRMTISRWMTAVAIVAIALGVDRMVRRAGRMRTRAAFHGREERQATEALSRPGAIRGVAADLVHHRHRWDLGGARFEETNELFDEMFASEQRRADYHGAMRRKYERAARYPWLPVEPDPPEPSP